MKSPQTGTSISVLLSPKHNAIMEQSKIHNKRTKRKEAQKRLEHHLEYFGVDWEVPKDRS